MVELLATLYDTVDERSTSKNEQAYVLLALVIPLNIRYYFGRHDNLDDFAALSARQRYRYGGGYRQMMKP